MANDFDDPFAPAEGTFMRPKPGGRRGPRETGGRETVLPRSTQDSRQDSRAYTNNIPVADFLAGGGNPILQAASPLIAIASRLQSTVANANVSALRSEATQEVRLFDDRLRASNVPSEDALVARYVLCTFFDSAVLNTPWGSQSDWSGQSLLIVFHKEKSGGEKFFQILERVSAEPSRYIDLIELLYVCLALGYEGMYRLDDRGQSRLQDLQHRLQRVIHEARRLRPGDLSEHWRGVEDKRNPILRYIPWWMIACVSLVVLVGVFAFYQTYLNDAAAPIKAALSQPAVKVEYSAPVPARTNRLKELLAQEEAAGRVTVEDFGDKTIVTPSAVDLFRSGSAQINPKHRATLDAITQALNQVPGKVIVMGHTDDQPIRSLQYTDNFELSRERAVAVANFMKPSLNNFGRVEWVGVGSTQPRYQPPNKSENRARNRRVEILNIDEGTVR